MAVMGAVRLKDRNRDLWTSPHLDTVLRLLRVLKGATSQSHIHETKVSVHVVCVKRISQKQKRKAAQDPC